MTTKESAIEYHASAVRALDKRIFGGVGDGLERLAYEYEVDGAFLDILDAHEREKKA